MLTWLRRSEGGGRGWYSEILAPFLKDRGRFYAASWDRDSNNKYVQRALKGYRERFVDHPEAYGRIVRTEVSLAGTAKNIWPSAKATA